LRWAVRGCAKGIDARWLVPALVVATMSLAACAFAAPATDAPAPATRGSATFDLAAVRAKFVYECRDPIVVDDRFCEQVQIAAMSAEGSALRVPTTLKSIATDRAAAICNQLAVNHFDGDDRDLGYKSVGILDRDGGRAAACSVGMRPPRYRLPESPATDGEAIVGD
jgi:hypothetical protein